MDDPAEAVALRAVRTTLAGLPQDSLVCAAVSNLLDDMEGQKTAAAAGGGAPPEFVERLKAARMPVRGDGDVLALTISSLVQKAGFIATERVAGKSAVPGFAPPVRVEDIDPSRPTPAAGWQSDGEVDGNCLFSYRDSTRRPYTLRTVRVASTLVLHFGSSASVPSSSQAINTASIATVELDIGRHITMPQDSANRSEATTEMAQWLDSDGLESAASPLFARSASSKPRAPNSTVRAAAELTTSSPPSTAHARPKPAAKQPPQFQPSVSEFSSILCGPFSILSKLRVPFVRCFPFLAIISGSTSEPRAVPSQSRC